MSRTKKSRGFQPRPSPPPREPSRRDVDREMTAEYIGDALANQVVVPLKGRQKSGRWFRSAFRERRHG